ncbi:Integrase core domain protein [Labrenzia sp. THAF82]|nr:Integrase core domain protein [Labrenzia sp. THAF82]
MGQVLHGSATTTEAIRRAIQNSQESLRALSKRYGINQKTVAKWKRRTSTADLRTGPKEPRSTVLSVEDEAIIVAFRRHTLLPLDDCLYALQPTLPHLTRSSLHRCLQRHGISRLPEVGGDKPAKKKFKRYPIGYFHIDIAEVRTAEGKLYLYVAIDRTSKFAFVQVVCKTGRTSASAFLVALIEAVPYRIHTVLTDNGIQFTFPPRYADGPTARYMTHMFDMRCRENGIEHRLTKVKHPWTNGQVERMNRTIKEATVKRLGRSQLLEDIGRLLACQIGIGACTGAFYWQREFEALGHSVRIIAPQYVKPFARHQKNDQNDAAAICTALRQPNMRFVPPKSLGQQDIQALHRGRQRLVNHRTALVSQMRGLLLDRGLAFGLSITRARREIPRLLTMERGRLGDLFASLLEQLFEMLCELDRRVA